MRVDHHDHHIDISGRKITKSILIAFNASSAILFGFVIFVSEFSTLFLDLKTYFKFSV